MTFLEENEKEKRFVIVPARMPSAGGVSRDHLACDRFPGTNQTKTNTELRVLLSSLVFNYFVEVLTFVSGMVSVLIINFYTSGGVFLSASKQCEH